MRKSGSTLAHRLARTHTHTHSHKSKDYTAALTDMMNGCCQIQHSARTGINTVQQRGRLVTPITITDTHHHRQEPRSTFIHTALFYTSHNVMKRTLFVSLSTRRGITLWFEYCDCQLIHHFNQTIIFTNTELKNSLWPFSLFTVNSFSSVVHLQVVQYEMLLSVCSSANCSFSLCCTTGRSKYLNISCMYCLDLSTTQQSSPPHNTYLWERMLTPW